MSLRTSIRPEGTPIRRHSALFAPILALALIASIADAQTAEDLSIPVPGTGQALVGRLCRPANAGLATLVVIAHGSPPRKRARPRQALGKCDDEAAQWFLSRGYAVAFSLRRGYGATGGGWAESYGPCERPDFVRAGLETARDIDATVATATAQPGIHRTGVVVVGQSAGGWGTLAYDSGGHERVAAMIAMAPGRGGHQANANCSPEALVAAAGRFGRTASTPVLWIDGTADSYFRPDLSRAMADGFVAAGGPVTFLQPAGAEHDLLSNFGGSDVWGPLVESYLAGRGIRP